MSTFNNFNFGSNNGFSNDFIQGNGNVQTKNLSEILKDKNITGLSVDSSININLDIAPNKKSNMQLKCEDNLIDNLTFEVVNNELKIKTKGSFSNSLPITLDLTLPELKNIITNGSGEIKGIFIGKELNIHSKGNASIDLKGLAKDSSVIVSGSSKINLSVLITANSKVVLSGSGVVDINTTGVCDVKNSGSGKIAIDGNPNKLIQLNSGSGKIFNTKKGNFFISSKESVNPWDYVLAKEKTDMTLKDIGVLNKGGDSLEALLNNLPPVGRKEGKELLDLLTSFPKDKIPTAKEILEKLAVIRENSNQSNSNKPNI